MNNFNGLKDCVDSVANSSVTPSANPTTGSLPVFTGPKSIGNGDLSGDCVTSGTLATICTKTNGAPFGPFATSTDAGGLTGSLPISRFANGLNANSLTFFRGDGSWAVPPGTGAVTSTPPVIRASNIASFNANSVTISWPAGTVAGDLVIVFVSSGYRVNNPAGWAILNNTVTNDSSNGLTAAKIMTAADITAGSATISVFDVYNGVAAATTIDGTTLHHIRAVTANRMPGSSSFPSAAVVGLTTAKSTDLIVGFTYVRGAMDPTISNFTQLQRVNAVNASGFLGSYATAPTPLGISETATYPAPNNSYYWSVVALR